MDTRGGWSNISVFFRFSLDCFRLCSVVIPLFFRVYLGESEIHGNIIIIIMYLSVLPFRIYGLGHAAMCWARDAVRALHLR